MAMFLYGLPGDILVYIRGFWLINHGLLEFLFPNQIVFVYFLKLPTLLLGEIYGLNLALFLMFVLGFVSFYFLVAKKVNINPKDRWGGTPLGDAKRHNHKNVINFLESHGGVV